MKIYFMVRMNDRSLVSIFFQGDPLTPSNQKQSLHLCRFDVQSLEKCNCDCCLVFTKPGWLVSLIKITFGPSFMNYLFITWLHSHLTLKMVVWVFKKNLKRIVRKLFFKLLKFLLIKNACKVETIRLFLWLN